MAVVKHILVTLALLGPAILLPHSSAAAQSAEAASEPRGSIGQTFFGSSRSSASSRSVPDRRGVPRLESLRGDHRQKRSRSTVPVNVNTLANGTANTPIPPKPRPRRSRLVRTLPSTVVQVHNQITVVNSAAAPERRRAVRSVDAARNRAEPSPEPAARDDRSPASEAESSERPAAERTGVSRAPLVKPLVSPAADEELARRDCVTLRITTSGGIEWRHEIGLDVLDASSVSGAASLLQDKLRRDEPIVVRSSEGGFTVPASLVESLIVGPCR